MKFDSTGEIDKDVLIRFFRISNGLEKFINKELETPSLQEFEKNISYCPILVSKKFAENYPARSRMSHKDSVYYCAPQLDHDGFLNGTLEQALAIYVDGLYECILRFKKLRANDEQLDSLKSIFDRAKLLSKEQLSDGFQMNPDTAEFLGLVDGDK